MSRRVDPNNITDADREYFAQFNNGEEFLTSAVSEEEVRKAQAARLAEMEKLAEEQRQVDREEAEKAAKVLESPASTGVAPGEKLQVPPSAKAIDPTAPDANAPVAQTTEAPAAPPPPATSKAPAKPPANK